MFSLIGQLIIDGLGMGLVYSLLAAGLVLILDIPRIFFIAYGQFYMIGAYVVWGSMVLLKLPFFVSLVLALLTTGILGILSYRLIFYYNQYLENNFLVNMVAAVGLMMVLQQGSLLVFGTESRGLTSVFPGVLEVGGMHISAEKLVLIFLALSVTIALYLLLQKTRLGRAMRAVSFRADVASLQGVNPTGAYLATMAIGCALSGFAGGIMAPVYAVSPEMGNVILTVLLVIMLGGMGSVLGAILGGLVLGMTLSFGYFFIGGGLTQILLFVVIGIILFFKPGGLLGQPREELSV